MGGLPLSYPAIFDGAIAGRAASVRPMTVAHVEVRRVRRDEADLLRRVRLSALADSPEAFSSTYEHEARLGAGVWTDRASTGSAGPDRAMFLAVLEGTGAGPDAVGLAGGYRPEPGEPVVELISMWTSPEARRTGVGRRLVEAVLEWAAAGGARSVGLWVVRGNAPAESLYRSMGFVETGDHVPYPHDPCKEETRMVLELPR